MAAFAAGLIATGACYVCAWGCDCEAWHDSIDEAETKHNLLLDAAGQPTQFVMTTWHARETLEEVMRFFKFDTGHPDVELRDWTIVHVSARDRRKEFLELFEATRS